MSRHLIAVAALAALLAASEAGAQTLVVTGDHVNLRAAPSLTSRIVATLAKGTIVETIEKAGDWYHVKTVASGLDGYVHRTLVSETTPPAGAKKPAAPPAAAAPPAPPPAAPPPVPAPAPSAPATAASRPKAAAKGGGWRLGIRAFGSVNYTAFTARQTFDAVLGVSRAPMYGGGVQILLPMQLFAQVEGEWFQKTGQRVFVYQGQVYPLGIQDKVTLIPIAVSGGYRFPLRSRLTPYGGGGVSYNRFKEQSGFAGTGDNTNTSFIGFQGFGGVEVRLLRWVSVAAEARYASVPNALKAGAAAEFGEKDLGGVSARVRVLVGR
jgi:opacity protein-like surface antigen